MVLVLAPMLQTALLTGSLLAGLPWLRASSTAPPQPGAETAVGSTASTPTDRVVLVSADAPEYRALAIPKSYKSNPDAALHLLVFRDGLCIRDRGLIQTRKTGSGDGPGTLVMEETGVTERATVASDGREAVVASTRYVSRVDVTPGTTSTVGDTVRSTTTLTFVDPKHPDGLWQVTLENGRWVKDLLVLPASAGLAVTTFLPRTGPSDLRILDGTGREILRVPETAGETLRLEASAHGGFLAAEIAFHDGVSPWERGVMVFDVRQGTQWTYGWRYGTPEEPTSWTLQDAGVLSIKAGSGTRRFDPSGRRL
jgi:hypothetical protein